MGRPALEVADIFRTHGPAWRQDQHAHLSLGQLKVMSAIEQCRTAALGGHVLRCNACDHLDIAYNSCRTGYASNSASVVIQAWQLERPYLALPPFDLRCAIVRVLAEGVETMAERNFLRNAGIELMQGYLLQPSVKAIGAIDPS